MTFVWLFAACCYGLLYGVFCLRQGRFGPGAAMALLSLFPLALGVFWLMEVLS